MDQNERVRFSQYVAEWQHNTRKILSTLKADDDDVFEVIQALGMGEAAARRWHMREAIESGQIRMPVIEDYDDTLVDVFEE